LKEGRGGREEGRNGAGKKAREEEYVTLAPVCNVHVLVFE
jgi:hypothetical protein